MVGHVYPDTMKVVLPDAYLIAIGKVCVQWTQLESVLNLALPKFLAMQDHDPRCGAVTAHMTWPLKIDILGACVDACDPQLYPWLARYKTAVAPLLSRAQMQRNRILHGSWSMEDDPETATLSRVTARGKLQIHTDKVPVSEIEVAAEDIGRAAMALLKLILNK